MRNIQLDIVKGVAIILVMVGHILKFNIKNYENLFLFNIIWSLQIPLFIIVSGYLSVYSGVDNTWDDLGKSLKKKSIDYLLPCLVWTFIIKVFILKQFNADLIYAIKLVSFNIDSGYWYLFVIYILGIIFQISMFISNHFKNVLFKHFALIGSLLCWIMLITISAWIYTPSFLGAKFILYYFLFYSLGFFIGNHHHIIVKWMTKKYDAFKEMAFFLAITIYTIIIVNTNLYLAADVIDNIMIRIVASVLGCYIVFYVVNKINNESIKQTLSFVGKYTLELYLTHALFCKVFQSVNGGYELFQLDGMIVFISTLAIMIILCSIIIFLISSNKYTKLVLFGKR